MAEAPCASPLNHPEVTEVLFYSAISATLWLYLFFVDRIQAFTNIFGIGLFYNLINEVSTKVDRSAWHFTAASRRGLIIFQSNKTEFLRYYLRNALSCANKAKQNRAFASVTYKIRCADFPVRAERVGVVTTLS